MKTVEDGHLGGYIEGGDSGTWSPQLWDWAIRRFEAKSIYDVGCGQGHSLEYFHKKGLVSLGIEGSKKAIETSKVPELIHHHDFCKGPYIPVAGTEPDLIWCCEFVEHLEEEYAPNFLQTFSFVKKALLMTYATPGQRGYHHVNCQPESYWIEKLRGVGIIHDKILSEHSRTLAGKTHYGRKGLVFLPK